jgi:acetyl/propionyl-CoA carboxylase alpha subunit
VLRRVLIANRGEIAVRIARTCTRLGVEYVAVHSDADARSPHLRGAVATRRLPGVLAADTYLNGAALVAAAREHDCDALHPGYGFLSESAAFARTVLSAGVAYIGPAPDTIEALGDKARARRLMAEAGVPILPGSREATESVATLAATASEVGYPVLLKPSAGGGGKGMQVVRRPADLQTAAEQAMRLARAHFDDARLLAERLLERPRHVEVQVFGDAHGNVVHLFERDCSLQRRQQKVIEEAPAPALAPELREAMLAAAVRGARAVGYRNAGTFEFLVADGGFHFLEVNTRLQVEHPVTEAITGLDLVEWQLRVAAGEPLPLRQPEIRARGHAIEARVYAEDAAAGLRPAPGIARAVHWPDGVRIESALEAGGDVSPYYDPMVAKLVAHGADRDAALAALRRALAEATVVGLTTNLGFLARVLDDPAVRGGAVQTNFLDDRLARFAPRVDEVAALACGAAMVVTEQRTAPDWPWSPAQALVDRRQLASHAGRVRLWSRGTLGTVDIEQCAHDRVVALIGDARVAVELRLAPDGLWRGTVAGVPWTGLDLGPALELVVDGERHVLERAGARSPAQTALAGAAAAPMPGVVVALPVATGDHVAAGAVLAVVEAMKMENRVLAPFAGRVSGVHCALRASVRAGEVLVTVEPEDA